jgi:potassium-dependent mechanosensitive channel
MRRRIAWHSRVLALLLLSCTSVLAQSTGPTTTHVATPGPDAIATVEIPTRADTDASFALDAIQRSLGQNAFDALESRLTALEGAVREQRELFKSDDLRLLPITRLESIERHWRFFARQIDAWRASLAQAGDQYLDDAATLGRRTADWKSTRATAEANGVPAALLDQITAVQLQLTQAEQAISGPLDKLLHLRARANSVAANIEAGQQAVTAAIAYSDSRLTRVDAPPLWAIGLHAAADDANAVKTGLQIETKFLQEYGQANRFLLRAYNLFELALLPLLIWLSSRVRKRIAEDPQTQASIRVLRRPFSSWLLIVMMGVLIVEPDAPIILHQFVLFIALIPVLRLLPPRVFAVLGPWPHIASGLYLLDLLNFLFLSNEFYHRLYLLFLTLLALGLLVWRLAQTQLCVAQGAQAAGPERAIQVVRDAGWIAFAVLCVSAIANLIGSVSLADMLTDALLFSAYVGLVLYASVHVLTSLIHLLLVRSAVSRLRIVNQHGVAILRGLSRLLQLAALAGWFVIMLKQFRIYRPIYQQVSTILTHTITFGDISLTLGGVLVFVFSVLLAFWVAKSIRFILRDEVLPNMSLPRGVANSVSSLTYYLLVIVGLSVALVASGFEIGQLAFAIGALGVGIGLGLQDVVKNFVSGLILMFERPIQPGDVIEVTGTAGKVRQIGMRATTLTTFDGADIVVPNGTLLSEKLINWTLNDMNRRFEVPFSVAYGTDPKRVLELVMDATKSSPGIARDPEPNVFFGGMGTSSLDFTVRAWTNDFTVWLKTRSDLTVRIHDAIVAAGIEIPFPQQDLHLRSIAPEVSAALSQSAQPTNANT